ncbi:MAG: S-layer homology domain-containing protein [bacterium]
MKFKLGVFLLFFVQQFLFAGSYSLDSPQLQMVGAGTSALGVDNPVILGDFSSFLNNPAILATVEGLPLGIGYKSILNSFDYRMISAAVPLQFLGPWLRKFHLKDGYMGFFYGDVQNQGAIETQFLQGAQQIWEKETFYSGWRLFGTGFGYGIYDRYGFDKISFGSNLKFLNFYSDKSVSAYSVGMDVGAIFSKHSVYPFMDQFDLSLSIRDLLSSRMIFEGGNEGYLSPVLQLGFHTSFNNLHFYMHSHFENSLGFAFDWQVQEILSLRASTDLDVYRLGVGVIFSDLSFVGGRAYRMALDYALEKNRFPYDMQHVLWVSFLGVARPNRPVIVIPAYEELLVFKKTVDLHGVGTKNSVVYLYNNDVLVHTFQTDKFGKWSIKQLSLNNGKNEFVAKTLDENMELSLQSDSVFIYGDDQAPQFTIDVVPGKGVLTISLLSNERLKSVECSLDGLPLKLERNDVSNFGVKTVSPFVPQLWKSTVPMPRFLEPGPLGKTKSRIKVSVQDIAGNRSEVQSISFFASLLFPNDKHVHYKRKIRLLGDASPFVQRLFINDQPVYIDKLGEFSMPVDLKVGKNLLAIKLELKEGRVLYYTTRVLRLMTFKDVKDGTYARREINFLATLGVFGDDSLIEQNFYPDRYIDRGFMAKLLVLSDSSIDVSDVKEAVFDDVPKDHPYAKYIFSALKNGLVSAFPDATFKPELPLTAGEIGPLLFKAGLTNFKKLDGDQNRYLTKAELAFVLAYLPEYQERIQQLIDWESGYFLDIK